MKQPIIGRKKELQLLENYCNSNQAEFVAVYGRRRVGKTFLIKQFFEERFDFYITGIYDKSKQEQLFNFNRQIISCSGQYHPMVNDWFEAFDQLRLYLESLPKNRNLVVFFDELPWMDTPKSKFLTALELFWNGWASTQSNLKLFVCGSATTWMTNKLLGHKGGLHNRVTRRMRLKSFNLSETEEYMLNLGFQKDRIQVLNCYMILGGTPYYLSMLNPKLSVSQNIDELFFSDAAPLREEYSFLFKSLFNDSSSYRRIVELLAGKAKGLTKQEIVSALKINDNGYLTEILQNLCDCDFIRKYSAYGKKERDPMYQLVDFYSLYYLRYVRDNNSQNPQFWTQTMNSGAQNVWIGYAFEQVCLRHIDEIRQSLGIINILNDVSSWQNAKAQIDLVIERKGRIINLVEMKYSEEPFVLTKAYYEKMCARRELFRESTKTTKQLHLTIVSPYGIAPRKEPFEIQTVVTLDDLFK